MSWQAYVDNNLVATKQVTKGAILGHDGSVWAKSPDFNMTAQELTTLATNMANADALRASGVYVEGEKHFCLRAESNDFAYTKKGDSGMTIVKCKQCILIGKYETGITPGNCTKVVEQLADYLKSVGY